MCNLKWYLVSPALVIAHVFVLNTSKILGTRAVEWQQMKLSFGLVYMMFSTRQHVCAWHTLQGRVSLQACSSPVV